MFGRKRRSAVPNYDGSQDHNVGIAQSTDYPFDRAHNGPVPESDAPNRPHEPPETKHLHHIVHMPHLANLPGYNHNGHKITKGIKPDGESGRSWLHPWHFVRICFRSSSTASMCVNFLWPFVPAAIAIHFIHPNDSSTQLHLWTFSLNYVAIVPTANLIGFAGQELARKLPKVLGILLETFLGGIVEIVLFMVLLHNNGASNRLVPVIRAAILGSILANLLLCLGACFFVGGLRRHEQEFHEVVSEVGNGLLLVAGFGLLIPSAFISSLRGSYDENLLNNDVLHISRVTAVILWIAFGIYVFFHTRTHHGLFDSVLEADEEKDHDRQIDLKKDKLTFTECILALAISLTCVSMHAVFLVEEIDFIVISQGTISDSFMGLILVPLVEKVSEHLTAVDEAWDNQMNFALAHILGATIQTALFNAPLVIIVGWGLDKAMDLNFEIFNIVCLILAIFVVGNFLRDGKSNYLEGSMCILIYILIAIASWYYPNPHEGQSNDEAGIIPPEAVSSEVTSAVEATATAAAAMLRMAMR